MAAGLIPVPTAQRSVGLRPISGATQEGLGQVGSGQDIAAAGERAGQALSAFAEAEDHRLAELDEAQARELLLKYEEAETAALHTGERALYSLRGAEAVARAPEVRAELEEIRRQIQAAAQGRRQQDMLGAALGEARNSTERAVSTYEQRETVAYGDATLAAEADNIVRQRALLTPEDPRFAVLTQRLEASVIQLAERQGAGPEIIQQRLAEAHNTAHMAVVARMLGNDDGSGALAYAREHIAEITDNGFVARLEREEETRAAFDMGDTLFEQSGYDEAAALELAGQIADPEQRETAEQRIRQLGSDRRRAAADSEGRLRTSGYQRVSQGENPRDWSAADRMLYAEILPTLQNAYDTQFGGSAGGVSMGDAALWLSYTAPDDFMDIDTEAEIAAGRMTVDDALVIERRQETLRNRQTAQAGSPEAELGAGVTLVNRFLPTRLAAAYPGTDNAQLRTAAQAYAMPLIAAATARGEPLSATQATEIVDQALRMAGTISERDRRGRELFYANPTVFSEATLVRDTLRAHYGRAATAAEVDAFQRQGGFVFGDIPAPIREQIADYLEAQTGTRGPFTNDQYVAVYMDYLGGRP